jgi:nucleoside-diphosphate-sugar epimerase
MYGITKVSGELLCDYYFSRYGVDTRGVRFPGLISYVAHPGGGTTDYAVEIFYEALKNNRYASYIDKDTYMDMMYMPDAVKAIIDLMEADPKKLIHRNAFNISAMSIDPVMLGNEIKKHLPEFELTFEVDPRRQGIAASWPDCIDVTAARDEWGFKADYDLSAMTKDMLEKLRIKLELEK